MTHLKFDIEFKKEQENLINIFFNNYDFIDVGNARVYHLDYVYDYEIWEKVLIEVKSIIEKIGFKINLSEFAHTLRFSYIVLNNNEIIKPHRDGNIRHFASLNIPLKGKPIIDLYDEDDKIIRVEYNTPILLNVNKKHGVINDGNTPRIILKVHFFLHSWEKLIESLSNNVNIFDTIPWYGQGKLANILNESNNIK